MIIQHTYPPHAVAMKLPPPPLRFLSLILLLILLLFLSSSVLMPSTSSPPPEDEELLVSIKMQYSAGGCLPTRPLPPCAASAVNNVTRIYELSAFDPAADEVRRAAASIVNGTSPFNAAFRFDSAAVEAVESWLSHQRYEPGIMSELVGMVRRPIDEYSRREHAGDRYRSCAVVGNSGILLNSNHGALIDSHEAVIRLNNAPAGGKYAADVGSKTGISFLNSNLFGLCADRDSCYRCSKYGDEVPILMYICHPKHFVEHSWCINKSPPARAPVIVTDARFDVLCGRIAKFYSLRRFVAATGRPPEEWKEAHEEGMFHYSSGMQAVVTAAAICDRVSVFGFGGGGGGGGKHHYHTRQRAELDLHDYGAEYEFYDDLASRPAAVPFLNESGVAVPPVTFFC